METIKKLIFFEKFFKEKGFKIIKISENKFLLKIFNKKKKL